MSIPLRIHLFGRFEVYIDGEVLTNQDWRSQQTRLIFKMLLARRCHVVSSDQIIENLWPSESPETSRRRLHVRISQLRAALGEGKSQLQTVDGGYLFNPNENCWLDADVFLATVDDGYRHQENGRQLEASKAYEEARELYRGDYLAEDLYVDWTFQDREFYRERYLTLLTELSEGYAQQGRYRLAIARCQEALTRDPIRETIYVRMMLYYYFAGERAQALRVFENCCQVLADAMSVKPLARTIELAEQIQTGTLWASADAPRYPPPIYEGRLFEVPYSLSETPFIGREREYAWLIDQWQNGESQVILIEGEAGIGKSRLLAEFMGYITTQGATVLRVMVAPGTSSPHASVAAALLPLLTPQNLLKLPAKTLATLSTLFPKIKDQVSDLPVLSALQPEAERQRFYVALDDLAAACSSEKTLLLVDDAHRLGTESCEMLVHLTKAFKILLSYRGEEISDNHPVQKVFRTLAGQCEQVRLQLDPLPSDSIQKLIYQLAQNSLPQISSEIITQTNGNPLYVVTLLQHMFEAGQLFVDAGGGWGITSIETPQLPQTIRQTIEARLRRLNRAQRRVFDLAVVLGGSFNFALLQQASQESEEDLLTKIDELIDLALISEPRGLGLPEFAVTHDRYTEVAYETLPAVRRRQLHHRAAKAIESIYVDDISTHYPALADHYAHAGLTEQECHYAILAGEQAAAQFGNTTALRYLGRALELTNPDESDQRFRLLLAREKVSDLLGDRQNQKSDLDELALLSDKLDLSQQAEITWRTGAFEWVTGEVETASVLLDEAITQAHSSGAVEIEAPCLLLKSRCVTHDLDLSHEYLEAALALARENGLRVIQGDIIRNIGNIYFWENNYAQSQANFEGALIIHREVGDLRGELSALNNLGHLSQLLGNPKSAREFYQQGLAICHKIGDRLAEGVLLGNLGGMLVELGEYDQAEIHLKKAIQIREEIKNEEGVGSLLPILGDALRRQGKYSEAKIHLERALEINLRIEHPQQQCLSLDGLSQLYRDLGDYETALGYFERALAAVDDEQTPNRVRALANGCLLLHLSGDNFTALEIGEKALALSHELHLTRAIALKNLGHVLATLEKYDQAQEKYQQAMALHQELNQAHLQPEPLVGLAQVALSRGADHQALSYAEKILSSIEATPFEGPDRTLWVYFTCYRVLQAFQDPQATDILKFAHDLIQARMTSIPDDLLRQSYLETVAVHREVIRIFQEK